MIVETPDTAAEAVVKASTSEQQRVGVTTRGKAKKE
jgi:hypothetical protein